MKSERERRVQRTLDEQGNLVGSEPALDDGELLELYRAMIAAREFDERVLLLQRTGRVPAYYQSSGQEASAAAGLVLAPQDWVVTAYREQPIRLARGVPIDEELAVFFNAVDLTWDPLARRITPLNATIGSHIPHATGLAYAMRYLQEDAVALAVFGLRMLHWVLAGHHVSGLGEIVTATLAHLAASTPPEFLVNATDLCNYNTRSTGRPRTDRRRRAPPARHQPRRARPGSAARRLPRV